MTTRAEPGDETEREPGHIQPKRSMQLHCMTEDRYNALVTRLADSERVVSAARDVAANRLYDDDYPELCAALEALDTAPAGDRSES